MSSVELNPLQGVGPVRAVSGNDRATVSNNTGQSSADIARKAETPGVAVEVNSSVDASTPPVDNDRVSEIRKALRDGSYPLVPTQIADAMIAARIGLGSAQ